MHGRKFLRTSCLRREYVIVLRHLLIWYRNSSNGLFYLLREYGRVVYEMQVMVVLVYVWRRGVTLQLLYVYPRQW